MSTFECPVVRVAIEPHPNADAIELARVGGYLAIVKKGQFKDGDLAVYIPEQAVLPEWLLKLLGFWNDPSGKGTLSGGAGNRVRAIKLRGVLSQGLLIPFMVGEDDGFHHLPTPGEHPELGVNFDYDAFPDVAEGQDFANYLGVIKYEPQVPAHLAGRTAGGDLDATIAYDFENLKKIPDLFGEGQEVVITEKIHGTCLQVGLVPRRIWEGKAWADKCPDFGDYKGVVTSKGQGAKGLMLDPGDDNNLYVRQAREIWPALQNIARNAPDGMPIFVFGEIFGAGVQDLGYCHGNPDYRLFDMYIGTRSDGSFVHWDFFYEMCQEYGLPVVPILWRGLFDKDVLARHTDGDTTLLSQGRKPPVKQIREGVVVRDVRSSSARHPRHGRYIAKSVSAAYLTRKGEVTEFN